MGNNSFAGRLISGIRGRLGKAAENPYRDINLGWLALKYYKHLPAGKLRTHNLFGRKLYFYSPAELLHGLEEIFIDKLYLQELPASPYIIDCGANIGLSVIYMKRLYPDAEIVAFEPDEKNFGLLSKNVESFGLGKVTLRKEAVWKEDTVLKFAGEGSMSSKISNDPASNTIEVKAVRLKDLLNRPVDFLKIDIEGAEFDVLNDVADKLNDVKNLFIEYHGDFEKNDELIEIFTIVKDNGFDFYIKEATTVYSSPFMRVKNPAIPYDIQLNIFCFRT